MAGQPGECDLDIRRVPSTTNDRSKVAQEQNVSVWSMIAQCIAYFAQKYLIKPWAGMHTEKLHLTAANEKHPADIVFACPLSPLHRPFESDS